MPELDGKVAIVTGAGRLRGIGRAAAAAYARLGADVVVTGTGRNPDSFPDDEKAVNWRDVESTADEVRALGRRALTMTVDVTNQEHVQAMIDGAVAEFGRVDILVNNAAFARGADRVPVADLTPDLFNLVMDIKVGGTFYCTKAFMEQITKQGEGGKIVNISSSAGKRGSSNTLAYNAANFAVVGMTQSMAREFGPMGVNVNCVCPGAVDTHRMDDLGRGDTWTNMAANTPIGRNGTDEEIGDFIAYLCTEAASWIQGQSINLNGGTIMEH
ncbi:MAG TPA: short-chain dehydrogenase [Dehalococcoidia bacterium]|jgi:3-oxoacyl-[acyl-carrier protein] reductase/meso-butanediol dehydrogenase/(S,S)-butanediol dehydrogenase/diacetyl reductase|nr:SDR family oxidoreductase [SAR202 cluster bacterium]HAC17257.1 short-chain dehydrogenase [Dehalococcoidia bacterium]HBJ29771.1 short-chain dehydrogenase [Dehalococcoidia bacterium]HCH07662.1 short-chain dehydrogenase [Dehalococcoidia bacterium]HIM89701.1 SDR family oxidoreductase [Dehalococcoidia bacterium]|tara:strand:- start:17239 stop:18051 length:813 start_codon:yes stop_codon:yes gene_type:complete